MNTPICCPSCGSADVRLFFEVDDVPVHNSLVLRTRAEACAFPRGNLRISFCERCAFIFNAAFDGRLLDYSPAYEDQQSFSATFNRFANSLARELVERYDLRSKNLIEIGCGKGDFLALLCTLGENTGIGIDPTAVPERLDGAVAARVRFLNEFYSDHHAQLPADFLCCRHTLEHIPNVAEFLRTVRTSLEGKPQIPVFFELPDVTRVLAEAAYWDMYYEHCSYFDTGSLARLFRSTGFDVVDLRRGFDDQYLLLDIVPRSGRNVAAPLAIETTVDRTRALVDAFAERIADVLQGWRLHFALARERGEKIAIWGSGSKCVAFLTTLRLDPDHDIIVTDINPHRHGKFIPGVGMEIVPPDALRAFRPDEVVVMNPIYRAEITAMLNEMGVAARVISADESTTEVSV